MSSIGLHLPEIGINLFAIILPWIELICGILLVIGLYRRGSILLLNMLLITFFVAITINLFRGSEIGCGCFSQSNSEDKISILYLLRDLAMIGVGFYVYFKEN